MVASLTVAGRANLYNQVIIVAAALLGFMLTAITILVSLDTNRDIVKELHHGEGFKLLIATMLATVVFLLILTFLGIVGASFDTGKQPARSFELYYEWIALASAFVLALSSYYLSIVTYKVAANA